MSDGLHDEKTTLTEKQGGYKHESSIYKRVLKIGLIIFFAEIIGGVLSSSLALFADSGHIFVDISNILVSIIVVWLVRENPEKESEFRKNGVIISILLLIYIAYKISAEAWFRLFHPVSTIGWLMFIVACAGAYGNQLMEEILHGIPDLDKNETGTMTILHVWLDKWLSYGVIISSIVIAVTGATWVDPLASFIIAVAIIINVVIFIWKYLKTGTFDHDCHGH